MTATIVLKPGASIAGLTPTFSTSDRNVATVTSDGRVTAAGSGTATITARIESFTATTSVSVTGLLVVSPATPTIFTNATQPFSVTAGGNGPFTWTVNGVPNGNATFGQINASGSYTAPAHVPTPASFKICAIQASPSTNGCATVTVVSSVAGIQLAPPTATLMNIGDSQVLTVTIVPENGRVNRGAGPRRSRRRAAGVATVSADGRVTATGYGTATITASIETFTATTSVVVGAPLAISPPSSDRPLNATQQFAVLSGGNGPFTWTVNGITGGNTTYGTITAGGFYTAPSAVPSPASFQICAIQATPTSKGCSTMTIHAEVPPGGSELLVFNDANMFDATGLADVNNQRLVSNLVTFTGSGPRATQTNVMVYVGHQPPSTPGVPLVSPYMPGYTLTSLADATLTTIPSTVKVVVLWMPTVLFSTEEVGVLKQFASEGGRIVFMGEQTGSYANGIPIENALLASLGSQMTNEGGAFDCRQGLPYSVTPAAQLNTTPQVMSGLTQLTMNCASGLLPGPNDVVLFRTIDGTHVLGAVAKIETTP